jgi:hypothetical protein
MIANVVQIAGAGLIALGIGAIYIPAGIITAGVLAILFGISLERK